LDAVTIAVPTRKHLPIALACLQRGLPVLVEKPLGPGLDDCQRLKAAAEELGVPLMVGHVERFNPAVQELKRRFDSGEVRRPLTLRACRAGPFFERERDVGVVHDLATHDIDVLRWLLDSEVEEVTAETEGGVRTPFEDSLRAELRFETGELANLEVNWLSDEKVRTLTLAGDGGVLVVDTLRQELCRYASQASLSSRSEPIELLTLPGAGEAPLREELRAFLRVVRREEGPFVTADDAVAAMRVVEALIEAGRAGMPVRLAAEKAQR
jgi:predicted dehydrogenase